jgi:ADP-ribose pyrophosphatase YjhB (NUDIX family)
MADRNAHCGYCGGAFQPDQNWPRACGACRNTTYRNPTPVAVVLLPVGDGLLTIRRDIEPKRGELALPGGYIDYGEEWRHAAARELREETGIEIDPARVREYRVLSAPDGTVLIFGLAPGIAELPDFAANPECSEQVVIRESLPMAFPLHNQVVREYFADRNR